MPAIDHLALLKALERGAAVLRRAGLGGVVDRSRGALLRGVDRFISDVRGITLTGDIVAHSHYVRELKDDDRERHIADLFEQSVPTGGLVMDVGAHLGFFTLLAVRRGARVIAVEPNPLTIPFLEANIEANGAQDRVTIVPKAVAGKSSRRSFFVSEGGDTSSLHRQPGTIGEVEVDVTTADAIVDGRTVDLIKIDVEGAELEALSGMGGSIQQAAPGLRLFVEWNPAALEAAGASPAELPAKVRELGMTPYVIDESTRSVRPLEADTPPAGLPYVNLLCVYDR